MDGILAIIYLIGGLFGLMMSFYLSLCFVTWLGEFLESKPWRYWK